MTSAARLHSFQPILTPLKPPFMIGNLRKLINLTLYSNFNWCQVSSEESLKLSCCRSIRFSQTYQAVFELALCLNQGRII